MQEQACQICTSQARGFYEQALALHRELEDRPGIALTLVNREGLTLHRKVGEMEALAFALQGRAELYASLGQVVPAVRL